MQRCHLATLCVVWPHSLVGLCKQMKCRARQRPLKAMNHSVTPLLLLHCQYFRGDMLAGSVNELIEAYFSSSSSWCHCFIFIRICSLSCRRDSLHFTSTLFGMSIKNSSRGHVSAIGEWKMISRLRCIRSAVNIAAGEPNPRH